MPLPPATRPPKYLTEIPIHATPIGPMLELTMTDSQHFPETVRIAVKHIEAFHFASKESKILFHTQVHTCSGKTFDVMENPAQIMTAIRASNTHVFTD